MFGFWKTWKALEARGIMGINRRNADYVLKYNKRSLYPHHQGTRDRRRHSCAGTVRRDLHREGNR